jgi:hypothetical protein
MLYQCAFVGTLYEITQCTDMNTIKIYAYYFRVHHLIIPVKVAIRYFLHL